MVLQIVELFKQEPIFKIILLAVLPGAARLLLAEQLPIKLATVYSIDAKLITSEPPYII